MIINLTQHPSTPEQLAAGVVDPTPEQRTEISRLLTFEELPDKADCQERARKLAFMAQRIVMAHRAAIATGYSAMIGGAPYLMTPLAIELASVVIEPLYAFSMRESIEETQPDGSVRKTAVFRHKGFVPAL